MDTLFVNACVRSCSRTKRLADALIARMPGETVELKLAEEKLQPLDEKLLAERDAYICAGEFDRDMFRYGRMLAAAEQLVIAAPYWDLSFPASLKIFVERSMATGLTFRYTDSGMPVSLCRMKRIFYISTAGGVLFGGNEGYQYIRQIGACFLGVCDIRLIQAEGLDIVGNDPEQIIADKIEEINRMEL